MSRSASLFLVVAVVTANLEAAGFVHNENFTVFTPAQASQQEADAFAATLLEKAERYRKEIALEWLGEELPPSIGQTIVNVSFSDRREHGLTWAKDNPERKFHTLYLVATPTGEVDSLLAHEMVHVVLATRYPHPDRLPAWLEEGIACRYDDASRKATRKQITNWFVRTENWPRLQTLLTQHNVSSQDQAAYAVSASLTEMLLSLGNRQTLLEFGQSADRLGCNAALKRHYGIQDVAQLQTDWQRWLTARSSAGR